MGAYQRLVIVESVDERRYRQWIAAVAKRYANIAQQPAPFRTSNGTRAEAFPELLFRQREQWDQFRVAAYTGSWTEFLASSHLEQLPRFARLFPGTQTLLHHLVDRANLLADIAAKDEVAHQRAQFNWNATAQFDGEIRDTARVIQHIRSRKRLCWTGVQADFTAPAIRPGWRIGG